MSTSCCKQNEVLEGIVSVRSGIGIRLFGAIRCLISMEAIENRSQTGPKYLEFIQFFRSFFNWINIAIAQKVIREYYD
jgi:hypothetical protein